MCRAHDTTRRPPNGVVRAYELLSVLGVISLPGDRISSSSWSTSNRRRSIFDRRMQARWDRHDFNACVRSLSRRVSFLIVAKEE